MIEVDSDVLLELIAQDPKLIACPLSWLGHIPFAFWLTAVLRPRIFVELGAYSGTSYFAFCQAVAESQLESKCFAVDTWLGDEHTGEYQAQIFDTFRRYHDDNYQGFSRYLRMTFDEARAYFGRNSVDLLHIDGLHTYDAVKHDFESWLPQLSDRAVVLFHDTTVQKGDFGVWKFWDEVSASYPSFNFRHSNGLGVLLVGRKLGESDRLLKRLTGFAPVLERLAEMLWLRQIVAEKERQLNHYQTVEEVATRRLAMAENRIVHMEKELAAAGQTNASMAASLAAAGQERSSLAARLNALALENNIIKSSMTWKFLQKAATVKKLLVRS